MYFHALPSLPSTGWKIHVADVVCTTVSLCSARSRLEYTLFPVRFWWNTRFLWLPALPSQCPSRAGQRWICLRLLLEEASRPVSLKQVGSAIGKSYGVAPVLLCLSQEANQRWKMHRLPQRRTSTPACTSLVQRAGHLCRRTKNSDIPSWRLLTLSRPKLLEMPLISDSHPSRTYCHHRPWSRQSLYPDYAANK